MAQQSQQLLALQALDAEIGRLARRTQQIDAVLADTTKSRAAELAIGQAEGAFRARQTEQRDREFELATVEARIKTHEQRLYSGKGSPRDLQALQQDIAHDRERVGTLEERALAAMEATEAARQELERIKARAAEVLGAENANRTRLVDEQTQVASELDRRRVERDRMAAHVDTAAQALYERLRQRMPDGVAVAEVVQGRCEGCRTALPSAEIQRARRADAPPQCSVCQRIIHVPVG
jgi:predicted  nucleic acid-binding Zn-ribbon protein